MSVRGASHPQFLTRVGCRLGFIFSASRKSRRRSSA
nr:MAG TPA: hypothetical protein [Caudoviricetes sp.]